MRDLSVNERLVVAPLIVLIVALGVFPKPVLDRITPSVDQIVAHVDQVTNTPVPSGLSRYVTPAAGAHRKGAGGPVDVAATAAPKLRPADLPSTGGSR